MKFLALTALLLAAPFAAFAQDAAVPVARAALAGESGLELPDGWRYRAGDDPSWADPGLDDASWQRLSKPWNRPEQPGEVDWNGIGWFRLHLDVAPDAAGVPLALELYHGGASEVFLDGRLVAANGAPAATTGAEQAFNPLGRPLGVAVTPGRHVLAIRYSNAAAPSFVAGLGGWIVRGGGSPWFYGRLRALDDLVREKERDTKVGTGMMIGGVCIMATLAAIHLLLFAFYPKQRANLYYGAFTLGMATIILANFIRGSLHYGLVAQLPFSFANRCLFPVPLTFFLAFVHSAFGGRVPRYVWYLLPPWFAAAIVNWTVPEARPVTGPLMVAFMLLVGADAIRVIWQALRRGQEGARIVFAGVLMFALVPLRAIAELFVPIGWEVNLILEPLSALGLTLSVSIFLARQFARTNRDLEAQLETVRELSRKAQELEEARELQLSMLPKKLPDLPHLEIAAFMKPATEVGGDYYDFDVDDDGTLTIAVGDATGHGLKAGTMVTATKSLFKAFARERDIVRIFAVSTRALKQMNLRSLFMGMLMMKLDGMRARLSTAGMPPALVYRAATAEVEEIVIQGMPLGSVLHFPYVEREIELLPGDVVVLMSDGFPERFNDRGEMLDYDRARALLAEIGTHTPAEIVDRFVRAGDEWANGHPQNDDVTFVVVKVLSAE